MTNLMRRATNEITAKTAALKRIRESRKAEEAEIIGGLAQLGAGLAAGFVDTRYGSPEEPANWQGIPTNALLGLGALGASMFKIPGRRIAARSGFTMLAIAEYRYIFDNGTFAPEQ